MNKRRKAGKKQTQPKKQEQRVYLNDEQIAEFTSSDDYVRLNTKLYLSYELLSVVELMASEIETGLKKRGLKLGGVFNDLTQIRQGFDRFEVKFHEKYFTHAGEDTLSSIRTNYEAVSSAVEKIENAIVEEGMRYQKYYRERLERGKGCDTCRYWDTKVCRLCDSFDSPETMSCVGYFPKGEEERA